MNSFTRLLTLFSLFIVSNVGCSQSVAFSHGDLAVAKQSTPNIDPLCERSSNDPFWVGNGTTTVACPDACTDGSHLECTAASQKQVVCVGGTVTDTGLTQTGAIIGPIGSCPVQSLDCGDHANGTSWYQDTQTTQNKTCDLCPDGSAHLCDVKVQAQYSCNAGTTLPTGTTQLGDVVGYTNECLPVPPKACGDHASGSTWWLVQGQQTAACQTCWDGSVLQCNYETEVQNLCSDGLTAATGQSRQGTLLGQVGQCAPQPKDCGDVKNGATTWQANGQTAPYTCDTCSDGSAHLCVAENDQEMMCNNGTLAATGKTKTGPFIGYTNTCPNVTKVSEAYTVPTAAPKADVMFVLDTTPANFKTLVSLGSKLANVLSAWNNVDWQVGIQNANPVKGPFEGHASGGLFEYLEPYPVEVSRPISYMPKGFPKADWILSRNASFNGQQWPSDANSGDNFCEQQPYCSSSYSEPLKEIVYAINQRTAPANKGFFRAGSTFVPIIISNTDERDAEAGATAPATVTAAFKKAMTSMRDMKAYSIIIKPGDTACLNDQSGIFQGGLGVKFGTKLDQFAKLTGGHSISLCEKDFSKALAGLSQDIRQQVSSITLKSVPVAGSLKIVFSPSFDATWTVSGTTVVFNKPLPPGTKLSISYTTEK